MFGSEKVTYWFRYPCPVLSRMTATQNHSLTKDILRAARFAESSQSVVGADWIHGWRASDAAHFPHPPSGWMSLPCWIDSRHDYIDADADAGWRNVPSHRILKKRQRALVRRRTA